MDSSHAPRPLGRRVILAVLALLMAAGFTALSVWQVERRVWKHELIEAVNHRVHQPPVTAPGASAWGALTAEADAYRKITASGHFLQGKTALVQAVTELGGGYWLLAPLDTGEFTVWVNRGYVPTGPEAERLRHQAAPGGIVTVTGLMRFTEPDGAFLRSNDPASGRWFSRDVEALSAQHKTTRTAPYFMDADATADGSFAALAPTMGPAGVQDYPVGGLTVVSFSDNHLVYALTWLALALLSAAAAWLVLADGRVRRNKAG